MFERNKSQVLQPLFRQRVASTRARVANPASVRPGPTERDSLYARQNGISLETSPQLFSTSLSLPDCKVNQSLAAKKTFPIVVPLSIRDDEIDRVANARLRVSIREDGRVVF